MLIDVECGIFCERGEKSHGNKIMEFETGTWDIKRVRSNEGKFFVVGESARTSGFKRKEVLFWEFANGAAVGKV